MTNADLRRPNSPLRKPLKKMALEVTSTSKATDYGLKAQDYVTMFTDYLIVDRQEEVLVLYSKPEWVPVKYRKKFNHWAFEEYAIPVMESPRR